MFIEKLSSGCANVNINYDSIFELNSKKRWRLSKQNYWNEKENEKAEGCYKMHATDIDAIVYELIMHSFVT